MDKQLAQRTLKEYEGLTDLQAQSIAQAQQVLFLLFLDPTLKVSEACGLVGISEYKYRYWLSKGESAIDNTRSLIDSQQKELVSEIARAKIRIIQMLISDATDITTKPIERAKLFEVLNEELNKLQTIYNVRPGIEETAQAFLKKGPTTEKKQSRFASIDVEETESGFRIGLNEAKDIIDGEIIDKSDESV
jgi:hypothetical protein